jgi:hypothetical protein
VLFFPSSILEEEIRGSYAGEPLLAFSVSERRTMAAIYLAARYSRHPEMQEVARRLTALGHTVTSRWIWGNHQCNDDELLNEPSRARELAREDLFDLTIANIFVLFTDPVRTATRGGKQVELGYAFGLQYNGDEMRVIIVGQPENVFQLLPDVEQVPDVEALYGLLEA